MISAKKSHFSEDLPQGGLKIPCILSLEGASKEIHTKWRNLLLLSDNPTAKSCTEMQPNTKDEQMKTQQCVCAVCWGGSYKLWLKNSCHWLTDQHVNYAQTLLQLQFPNLDGLCPTMYQSRSLQSQPMHAASHPLLWQSLDCCNHYTMCPWRSQIVWLSVHITGWWTMQRTFAHRISPFKWL